MNINHLRYFDAVCRYQSVTRAAQYCFVSPPSVTSAIHSLEKELNYKLFDRRGNRMTLTPEGEAFRDVNASFLIQFSDFEKQSHEIAAANYERLRFSIPPGIMGCYFIERIYPDFKRLYPNIHLYLAEYGTMTGKRELGNADLDLVLGIDDGEPLPEWMDSIHLFDAELQLAVNRAHPFAGKSFVTKEMIEPIPLIIMVKGTWHYAMSMRMLSGMHPNIIMEAAQIQAVTHMLHLNMGAVVIFHKVFEKDEDIVCIPFQEKLIAPVYLYWRKNGYQTRAMKMMISYLAGLTY